MLIGSLMRSLLWIDRANDQRTIAGKSAGVFTASVRSHPRPPRASRYLLPTNQLLSSSSGSSTWSVVPPACGLRSEIVPPIASARSFRPSSPDPCAGVGTTDAVVADGHAKHTVRRLDSHVHDRRTRVLRRIRERLRDDVVRRHLDGLRQPHLGLQGELDRDRRAARERLERRPEPALGEDRRMDPESHLTELVEHAVQSLHDVRQLGPVLAKLWRHRRLRCAQLECERNELLLGAVVEIAL